MSREPDRPTNAGETSRFQDTASELRDRASDVASRVKEKAAEVGSTVSDTLRRQRENAAGGLDRVASTLHENAESLPGGGRAARAAHGIAGGMESTASYLREHDVKAMGDDLIGVCRRHPVQALLSAVVVGFFIGRAARR
jgi:hypothetical protein